jgi:hypothetical protein
MDSANRNLLGIDIVTKKPLAYDLPDHLRPRGRAGDNSTNPRFHRKLYAIFPFLQRPLRVLDLGCSDGKFIRSCRKEGCLCVGLEDSDYSKRIRRARWAYLGDRFTTGLTSPFELMCRYDGDASEHTVFNIIASCDVLELICTDQGERWFGSRLYPAIKDLLERV